MNWTYTNLVIQIIAGILGGHAAAIAVREHSFGAIGHTVAGAVGGAFSGYFLQTLAATVANGTGGANDSDVVSQAILQALTGLAAGAILTLVVGFSKQGFEQDRAGKS
jgi:hypothetical protein